MGRFEYEEIIFRNVVDNETGEEVKLWSPVIKDNGRIIYDGKCPDDVEKICEMLNEMNNEIICLKKDIEYYKEERGALFEYLDKKDDLKLELRVDLNE